MTSLISSRKKTGTDPKPNVGTDHPIHDETATTASRIEPTLMRLLPLLQELAGLGGGPPPDGPDGGDDDSEGRDEDDHHVYYCVQLPERQGPDVDVNLHGQTLMIRIEKTAHAR